MERIITTIAVASCLAVACDDSNRPLDASTRARLKGLVYYHHDGKVRRIAPDGTGDREISGEAPAFVYPAGNDRIFLVERDDLFVARPDGSQKRALARSPGVDWYPRLSRYGKVLFESSRSSFRDLYSVPVDGGDVTRMTDDREGNFDGAWSPDGKRIAFASSRYGQLDLFVANADMTDVRRLTRHPGDAVKPAWAPDGARIAFLSRRDGEEDVFVIEPDGTGITNLTREIRGNVERFSWHPQEALLLAAVRLEKKSKIHSVAVDSREAAQLSSEEDDDSEPSWSPDGRHVVFVTKVKARTEIFIMRADGTRRTRVGAVRDAWLPRWLEVEGR